MIILLKQQFGYKYKNNKTPRGLYLAPCRLLHNRCLLMVYVEIDVYDRKMPKWVRFVDNEQVGIYKDRYVAYDYALDVDVPDELVKKYFGFI